MPPSSTVEMFAGHNMQTAQAYQPCGGKWSFKQRTAIGMLQYPKVLTFDAHLECYVMHIEHG